MHKYLKIILIVIAGCYLINLLGCSSHPCVGKWHGSYIRSYDVRETWDITINKEGTCIAREIGSGGANYEENYKGTWETVSDEIIYMYLESEPRSRKMTYSQSEIDSYNFCEYKNSNSSLEKNMAAPLIIQVVV